MSLDLNMSQAIGKGAMAVIFSDGSGTRVYKLFRQQMEGEPESFRRMVFASELRAAAIANRNEATRIHVPVLYGVATVSKVVDAARGDVSHSFMLDCCIVSERIPGSDEKLGLHALRRPHILTVVQRLRELDILFVDDISVFLPEDPDRFKIIDYGMRDPHVDAVAFCDQMQMIIAGGREGASDQ